MTTTHAHKISSGAIIFAAILALWLGKPCLAAAQTDGAAVAIAVPTAVMANTSFTSVAQYLKSFTLDKLATMAAKQILHQITAATINWINSGFKGSPAFISNPAGFFLDAADQITGAFLAGNGPLSQLCSPFSIDIKVTLALEQGFNNQRYTCTLSKVINNLQNNTTINGQNIKGFMSGNFAAGGWSSFISMTTVPQNNPFGAYLQSSSDLHAQIGTRHAGLTADLNLGNGFLSWSSCQDVSQDEVADNMAAMGLNGSTATTQKGAVSVTSSSNKSTLYNSGANTQVLQTGNGTSYKATADSNGNVSYQDCQTQTPGSVISSKLMTSVNNPEVELELANDINAVINALMSEMVSQLLNQGLRSLSSSGSGVSTYSGGTQAAYTAQLQTDATSAKPAGYQSNGPVLPQGLIDQSPAVQSLLSIESMYNDAEALASNSQSVEQTALACFQNKLPTLTSPLAVSFAKGQMSDINSKLTELAQRIQTLTSIQTDLQGQIDSLASSTDIDTTANIDSTQDIETQIQNYQAAASSIISQTNTAISTANTEYSPEKAQAALTEASTTAAQDNADSSSRLTLCNNLSDLYPTGQIDINTYGVPQTSY